MKSKHNQAYFFVLSLFFTFVYACTPLNELEEAPNTSKWKIWFLDVGQGSCTLVQDEDKYWLFDLGPNSQRTAALLDSLGVTHIEGVFLGHNDLDHYGGLYNVIESGVSISTIYRSNDQKVANTLETFLDSLVLSSSTKIDTIYRGWEFGNVAGLRAQLIWPYKGHSFEGNAASQVFKISVAHTSVLLMGDLEYEQELELIQKENSLGATVLNAGHHGSKTSSSLEILDKIQPSWVVISSGENSYGHPEQSTLANLYHSLQDSSHLLRTDTWGTMELQMTEGGYFWPEIETKPEEN